MQADPANHTAYEPLSLHTNIVKWNPRAFLCIGCANDKEKPVQTSDLEGETSSIHQLLVDHTRIYARTQTKKYGVDPEALLRKTWNTTSARASGRMMTCASEQELTWRTLSTSHFPHVKCLEPFEKVTR